MWGGDCRAGRRMTNAAHSRIITNIITISYTQDKSSCPRPPANSRMQRHPCRRRQRLPPAPPAPQGGGQLLRAARPGPPVCSGRACARGFSPSPSPIPYLQHSGERPGVGVRGHGSLVETLSWQLLWTSPEQEGVRDAQGTDRACSTGRGHAWPARCHAASLDAVRGLDGQCSLRVPRQAGWLMQSVM